MTPPVHIVLLAAGQSRRMRGRDKLLEPVDGLPLIRRMAQRATSSTAQMTHVVVPPHSTDRRAALEGLDLEIIEAEHAARGMSASLKAGLEQLPGTTAALILLADMPEIETKHLNQLISAFEGQSDDTIVRAADFDGRPGNPVLFGPDHLSALMSLTGDQGARDILRAEIDKTVFVELDGTAARLDLDTPEAWAAWRAKTES